MKKEGDQNPKTETTLWGREKELGQNLVLGKRWGAYLDCGRSAVALHPRRQPGQRCSEGSPGHSAPAPGSCAAGTAPCRWRDRAPRREERPLALPDTHSTQHQEPPAAQCPGSALTSTAPPSAFKPPLAPITHLLIHRLICSLCSNTPRLVGSLGVG